MAESEKRRPLVIVATEGEWTGRSLESVLGLNDYDVLRTQGGRRALELTRRARPDALIVDESPAEMSGIEVARALRDDPLFDHSTPIVILAETPVAGAVKTAAYAAGAWEYSTQPLDIETLLLKLGTFVRAKQECEAARDQPLIDRLTGVYSANGLRQWAQQIGARAVRYHEPLACVAVMPRAADESAPSTHDDDATGALAHVAELWRAQGRRSDIIGRLDDTRLAILAPDTNGRGAVRLVERLRTALDGAPMIRPGAAARTRPVLSAGYYAVDDFAAAAVEPSELMRRAEAALEYAQRARSPSMALSFDELPRS